MFSKLTRLIMKTMACDMSCLSVSWCRNSHLAALRTGVLWAGLQITDSGSFSIRSTALP